jgi:hypothetical protein
MNNPRAQRALAAFHAFMQEQEDALDLEDDARLLEALRAPRPEGAEVLSELPSDEVSRLVERSHTLELRIRTLRNQALHALTSERSGASGLRSYARSGRVDPRHDLDVRL